MPALNFQKPDIQRIVQEVLRRLGQIAQGQTQAQTQTQAQVSSDRIDATTVAPAITKLVWSQSVVSAEALQGRLDGIGQLVVSPKAIVTPAARDELRERGIDLAREGELDSGLRSVPVGVQDTVVAAQTAQAIPITSDDEWTTFFHRSIQNGDSPLAVAPDPHRLACLVNRDETVRAVAVTDLRHLEDAVSQTAANVLCVSPAVLAGTPLSLVCRRFQQVARSSVASGGIV
jgi:pyruvate/2-oxoglutarate dehydrogenase complex dihydrolipoamide acyltransferase (E2) component